MRYLILALALFTLSGHAQERIALDVPVKADPGATQFRVSQIVLNLQGANLSVILDEVSELGNWVPGGKQIVVRYEGPPATTIMRTLNTADLSSKSLQRRLVERLQADGKLGAGSITGTPE